MLTLWPAEWEGQQLAPVNLAAVRALRPLYGTALVWRKMQIQSSVRHFQAQPYFLNLPPPRGGKCSILHATRATACSAIGSSPAC